MKAGQLDNQQQVMITTTRISSPYTSPLYNDMPTVDHSLFEPLLFMVVGALRHFLLPLLPVFVQMVHACAFSDGTFTCITSTSIPECISLEVTSDSIFWAVHLTAGQLAKGTECQRSPQHL